MTHLLECFVELVHGSLEERFADEFVVVETLQMSLVIQSSAVETDKGDFRSREVRELFWH